MHLFIQSPVRDLNGTDYIIGDLYTPVKVILISITTSYPISMSLHLYHTTEEQLLLYPSTVVGSSFPTVCSGPPGKLIPEYKVSPEIFKLKNCKESLYPYIFQ